MDEEAKRRVRKITDALDEKVYSSLLFQWIKDVCKDIGPGAPGYREEVERGRAWAKAIGKYCDRPEDLTAEPFVCRPGGFFGWITVSLVLTLLSIVILEKANFLFPLIAGGDLLWTYRSIAFAVGTVLMTLTFIVAIGEFFNYRETIDFLYPEHHTENHIATFKPTGEVKGVVLISGHQDSAPEYIFRRNHPRLYDAGTIFLAIAVILTGIIMPVSLIFSILGFQGKDMANGFFSIMRWIGLIPLVMIIPALPTFKFFGDNLVPGAMDNLGGDAISIGVARFLHENPHDRPKHVEVRCLSFSCEEAGLRGAERYVTSHARELEAMKEKGIYFANVNYDGVLGDGAYVMLDRELTTRTRHDPELCTDLKTICDALGYPLKVMPMGLFDGGTDARPFSRRGYRAATLLLMKDLYMTYRFYHSREDVPDNLNPQALADGTKISLGYIALLDYRLGADT